MTSHKLWLFGVLALIASACGSTTDSASPTTQAGASTSGDVPVTAAPDTASSPSTAAPTTTASPPPTTNLVPVDLAGYQWEQRLAEAPWSKRAGLRVVELDGRLLLLGGRTPNQSTIPGDSQIWADVWASDDAGASWELIAAGDGSDGTEHWSARAYFQAVTLDGYVYVLGGQDYGLDENPFCALLEQGIEPPPGLGIDPDAPCPEFLPSSQFFNDVWRSTDGVTWEQMTEAAPWAGRAGLMAAVLDDAMYVFGGSQNDDSSIIGPNGPERLYFNDVWRSTDGAEWEEMTAAAAWEPRAGGAVVNLDGFVYLLGGEDGFTCTPLPDCDAPYFNDVWRTADGENWELVTESAGFSPRPGHVCELLGADIVCFGGFGLIENPMDIWVSSDAQAWEQLDAIPWDAGAPEQMRYDFDALVFAGENGPEILAFGGDRETFDFADPENYLRVDNDVWSFSG